MQSLSQSIHLKRQQNVVYITYLEDSSTFHGMFCTSKHFCHYKNDIEHSNYHKNPYKKYIGHTNYKKKNSKEYFLLTGSVVQWRVWGDQ